RVIDRKGDQCRIASALFIKCVRFGGGPNSVEAVCEYKICCNTGVENSDTCVVWNVSSVGSVSGGGCAVACGIRRQGISNRIYTEIVPAIGNDCAIRNYAPNDSIR